MGASQSLLPHEDVARSVAPDAIASRRSNAIRADVAIVVLNDKRNPVISTVDEKKIREKAALSSTIQRLP